MAGKLSIKVSPNSYYALFDLSTTTGMEDSADNFARGHYTEGRKHIGRVSDQMRRLVEACDSVQVIIIL